MNLGLRGGRKIMKRQTMKVENTDTNPIPEPIIHANEN